MMLQAQGVVKAFGLRPVLRGVDLSVKEGESLALFGPNGAGKTTLLRIFSSLTRPTAGLVKVAGFIVPAQVDYARGMLGVVSHSPLLYGDLTAQENLRFYAQMYNLDDNTKAERIEAVLNDVGLGQRGNDLVRTFSRGMQQRLAIARAILHDPPVLLLDEPFTGLDQDAAETLNRVLREVATRGRTILMTTHNFSRGLELTGRIAILSRGKIAHEEKTDNLDVVSLAKLYSDVTGMVGAR